MLPVVKVFTCACDPSFHLCLWAVECQIILQLCAVCDATLNTFKKD